MAQARENEASASRCTHLTVEGAAQSVVPVGVMVLVPEMLRRGYMALGWSLWSRWFMVDGSMDMCLCRATQS